jgi:hypothetical protein
MAASYSFINVQASIVGPGGAFSLGYGSGNASEGIDIETNETDVLTIGADGTPMHSLKADKSGKVTVRLLKTSPVNAKLMALFNVQRLASATWGQNTITIVDTASGSTTACRACAFLQRPKNSYATEGGTNEWVFSCGIVDEVEGVY